MTPSTPRLSSRALVFVSAIGTAMFLVLYAIAVALYPGGTWFDRHSDGHSWTMNFLCDLMQTRALNGQRADTGAWLARIGAVVMFGAIAAFFVLVSRLEIPETRAGRVARKAGAFACALGAMVPLTQSDREHTVHHFVVLAAFAPALVAALAAVTVCSRAARSTTWIRATAWLTLGSGAFDGFAYAYAYAVAYGVARPVQQQLLYAALPGFQRIATVGLIAWMASVWRASYSVVPLSSGPPSGGVGGP